MDAKLETRIDEIFKEVPKTDKMILMINRIKSKANSKYLDIREKGFSRAAALNEIEDWLMKAKVIIYKEAEKIANNPTSSEVTPDNLTYTPISVEKINDTDAVVIERADNTSSTKPTKLKSSNPPPLSVIDDLKVAPAPTADTTPIPLSSKIEPEIKVAPAPTASSSSATIAPDIKVAPAPVAPNIKPKTVILHDSVQDIIGKTKPVKQKKVKESKPVKEKASKPVKEKKVKPIKEKKQKTAKNNKVLKTENEINDENNNVINDIPVLENSVFEKAVDTDTENNFETIDNSQDNNVINIDNDTSDIKTDKTQCKTKNSKLNIAIGIGLFVIGAAVATLAVIKIIGIL